MPHLRIDYSGNLDPQVRMDALCQSLAAGMAALRDGAGKSVFPLQGTRVMAWPAPYHAVADGRPENGFIYLNLRITPGREAATVAAAGEALLALVRSHIDGVGLGSPLAITLHIDEIAPAWEGRYRPS